MHVLVTGASGFIGSAVMQRLYADGAHVLRASTQRLGNETDWTDDLQGITSVVHCAARVHTMKDEAADPITQYRAANVDGTLALARQSAKAGVERFIFLSSIKVNGEVTQPLCPFTAEDTPAPQDAYAISKHEAELGLRALEKTTGMEVVILRPPLVYGPGVKGNFATFIALIKRGFPLPFAAISNQRSFVALDNLVDLIVLCLTHPEAAHQTFLVSDNADLSTPDLLRTLATSMGKTARLIPVPTSLLYGLLRLAGKPGIAQRLCGSLQVDIQKTTRILGWTPPHRLPETFGWLAQK